MVCHKVSASPSEWGPLVMEHTLVHFSHENTLFMCGRSYLHYAHLGKYTIGLGQSNMAVCTEREDINSVCLSALHGLMGGCML